jgi:two-component system OmpR family response regulator
MANKTIMIVDDEDSVLKNLTAFYEDEGYRVISFFCSEDALAVLPDTPVDICIVDMRLPGMDGNTFIIAAHLINPAIKFIIHTGSSDYTLPEELKRIGLTKNHIHYKPVPNLSDLLKELN